MRLDTFIGNWMLQVESAHLTLPHLRSFAGCADAELAMSIKG